MKLGTGGSLPKKVIQGKKLLAKNAQRKSSGPSVMVMIILCDILKVLILIDAWNIILIHGFTSNIHGLQRCNLGQKYFRFLGSVIVCVYVCKGLKKNS